MWRKFGENIRKDDVRIPVTSREIAELCFAEILLEAGIYDSQLPGRLIKSLGATSRPVSLIQKETLRGLVMERDQLLAENTKVRRYAERLKKLIMRGASFKKKARPVRSMGSRISGFFR